MTHLAAGHSARQETSSQVLESLSGLDQAHRHLNLAQESLQTPPAQRRVTKDQVNYLFFLKLSIQAQESW